MADYTKNEQVNIEQEDADAFNLKTVWRIFILHWHWVVLSIILCLGCAFAYLRYTTPIYSVSAKILVKDENKKPASANALSLADMGIISNSNGFDNELEILTSTAISGEAIKELKLYTRYFVQGKLRKNEIYKNSPIIVDMVESDLLALENNIKLTITKKGNGLHIDAELAVEHSNDPILVNGNVASLPNTMQTPYGTLVFSKNHEPDAQKLDGKLIVTITPLKAMAADYAKELSAQATSKTTTVANLGINDNIVERGTDYLNQLILSYNEDANKDKNEVAEKTRIFIDERIDSIGKELGTKESELEVYKKRNELINLSNDATNSLAGRTDFQKEQAESQTEITLVKSLIDYVTKPENDFQVIPANLGLKDQTLNKRIESYNDAVLQYNRLSRTGAESNPALRRLHEEIIDMHTAIEQSLSSVYANLLTQKRSIDKQYEIYAGRIQSTPTHERTLNDIGRQQEIKSGLYLMLLQKREENFISLASTATKAKVIDAPRYVGKVSPKASMIWLVALVLGACIPIAIFYLLELMRIRIEGRSDVEKLTKIPVIGDVPLKHKKNSDQERAIVVSENVNDSMEETFRGLRTNLRFIMNDNEKVILTTSTIPGEGKTFIASNLAMSFALLGKKVIIVGLDIRKPRLVNLFNLPKDKRGITEFLRTTEDDFELLEAQIYHGVINQHLDVMPAGIIPPNPGELISRNRLDVAFNYLRTKYDVIIIDTPPVGLVSDTLEIGRVADVSLYVCRADYSPKANFELINNVHKDNKLPKMSLVLNGVDLKKKKYGYYYGYGKYGKYGKYGHYGHYGHYGVYGNYSSDAKGKKSKDHTEK